MKIGLLGGSFNPAHLGHLHVSEAARKRLGLAQVWWLVSPGNPLKPAKDMMGFEARFASAREVVGHNPIIKVLDVERRLGTRFTVDTIKRLKKKYPGYQFYWLMGADNLVQLPRWKRWREIVGMVPLEVFDRGKLFYRAVNGVAYQRCKGRIRYHNIARNPLSSTAIRGLTKLPNS